MEVCAEHKAKFWASAPLKVKGRQTILERSCLLQSCESYSPNGDRCKEKRAGETKEVLLWCMLQDGSMGDMSSKRQVFGRWKKRNYDQESYNLRVSVHCKKKKAFAVWYVPYSC